MLNNQFQTDLTELNDPDINQVTGGILPIIPLAIGFVLGAGGTATGLYIWESNKK